MFLRRYFGVCFSHGGLIRLLRRLGLSFQRPDRRARQADPEAIDAWTRTEYPAIHAQATAEGGVVLFADQVGARSDHLSGRTWGRRGETPTLARTGNRFAINAMSAICTTGQMSFTVLPGRFDAATCVTFFDRLVKHFAGQKIHLVCDRHPVHRSAHVREWVTTHTEAIELHFLPAYAPHLNPDELVNADLKRQLADRVIITRADLITHTRSILHSIQKLPARVTSYFTPVTPNTHQTPISDRSISSADAISLTIGCD